LGRATSRWSLVLLIGASLAALNCIWITYVQVVWNQGFPTVLSFYFNAVFTLVLVAVLNAGVRRVVPKAALTGVELLVIFVMVNVGTTIQMLAEYIVSQLAYPYHFQNLDKSLPTLVQYLPRWLTVSDPQAGKDFYLGRADLWKWASLKPWLTPALAWGAFIVAIAWTGVCLASLVYNRWRHEERLSFPLLQIPLMIAEPKTRFYKTWLFWTAFGIAAGINIINALSGLYPAVPSIAVKRAALQFTGLPKPWSALSPVLYSFNPFLIGLEFFLPLDLLFSVFFFYWAARLECVALAFIGSDVNFSPDNMVAPYVREQSVGALFALLAFSFWVSRGRWRDSWKRVKTILSTDTASVGAAVGATAMVGMLVMAGMQGYVAVMLVAMYVAVVVSLSRIRAQYGPPAAGLFLGAPGAVVYQTLGTQALGTSGLAHLETVHWMDWDHTNNPMPDTLEGHAMTEGKMRTGVLIAAVLVAVVVGYFVTFGTVLSTGYQLGQATAKSGGTQVYYARDACGAFARRTMDAQRGLHADSAFAMMAGAAVALLLQAIRTRYAAFPLHPVGYAVASTYVSTFLWSTAAITWVFKLTLLRYWGLKGYHRAAPFFLGLVLGEFVVGSILSILSVVLKVHLYVFWPY
jgi:hypothetical protein